MNDYVIVKIIGKEVDVMCRVSDKYKKYMGLENGKRVLYLWLKKALYGCMQSAILRYNTFKKSCKYIFQDESLRSMYGKHGNKWEAMHYLLVH